MNRTGNRNYILLCLFTKIFRYYQLLRFSNVFCTCNYVRNILRNKEIGVDLNAL